MTPPLRLADLLIGYITSSAQIPSSWKWQRPHNHHGVYLGTSHNPTMLALRSKDIVHILSYWERIPEGSSPRSQHWQVHDEAIQIRNALIIQLDRFKARKKVFKLIRTNQLPGHSTWALPFISATLRMGWPHDPLYALDYGRIDLVVARRGPRMGRTKVYRVSALGHETSPPFSTLRDARADLRAKFEQFVGEVTP